MSYSSTPGNIIARYRILYRQVSEYRAGKEKVFGFLVGQIMKATQGKADPQMVNEILRKKLQS